MIPLRDQELLRLRFAQDLIGRVRIDLFTQRPSPVIIPGQPACPFCKEARILMQEIASLSRLISLGVHEFGDFASMAADLGVDKVPGIVLRGAENRGIRFFGMPTGAEFPTLIATLVEISRGENGLTPATQRQLRKINDQVKLQVMVVPSCIHSPEVARSAYRFGLQNARIKTEVIELGEFPQLATRYAVRVTPTIVIDEKVVLAGSLNETSLVEALLTSAEGKPLSSTLKLGPSTTLAQDPDQEMRAASGLIIPR